MPAGRPPADRLELEPPLPLRIAPRTVPVSNIDPVPAGPLFHRAPLICLKPTNWCGAARLQPVKDAHNPTQTCLNASFPGSRLRLHTTRHNETIPIPITDTTPNPIHTNGTNNGNNNHNTTHFIPLTPLQKTLYAS